LIRIYESYIRTIINDNIDLKDWVNLINDFKIINKEIYEKSIVKMFKTKKSTIKFIENSNDKNTYTFVKNYSTDEYIIFIKLSDEKLEELGYVKNHREILGIKSIYIDIADDNLDFFDEEKEFNF
jgi:hypothetical protein